MDWTEEFIDKNSFIQTYKTDTIMIQVELIERVNIFNGDNLFGNYYISATVFKNGKQVENETIDGLNANVRQAINTVNKLKIKLFEKYIVK